MFIHFKKTVFLGALCFLASLSVSATEVSQVSKGITLNANLELVSGKVLGESIILMTHGTLAHGNMEIMSQLQGLFKENELDSLSINLGLGLNNRKGMYDCATTHTHKHTDAVDEIALWVGWLKKQGVKSITLLGHSRGGNQTAWYAAERADSIINKVILIAPATWSESYAVKSYKKRFKKDLKTVLAKAESLIKQGKGKTVMKNTGHIYCENTSVTAESFVSYNKPDIRLDTPSLLKRIKQPVLVIAGSKDKTVKNLDKLVAPMVKKGKIDLFVIDGAGHMFRDLYADDMVDLIVEYLSEG
jgi:pimeloyl-ACP methyl ester carboxylesterase